MPITVSGLAAVGFYKRLVRANCTKPVLLFASPTNVQGFVSVCFLPLKNKKDKKQIASKPVL